jgi:hypothetical protein
LRYWSKQQSDRGQPVHLPRDSNKWAWCLVRLQCSTVAQIDAQIHRLLPCWCNKQVEHPIFIFRTINDTLEFELWESRKDKRLSTCCCKRSSWKYRRRHYKLECHLCRRLHHSIPDCVFDGSNGLPRMLQTHVRYSW